MIWDIKNCTWTWTLPTAPLYLVWSCTTGLENLLSPPVCSSEKCLMWRQFHWTEEILPTARAVTAPAGLGVASDARLPLVNRHKCSRGRPPHQKAENITTSLWPRVFVSGATCRLESSWRVASLRCWHVPTAFSYVPTECSYVPTECSYVSATCSYVLAVCC